MVSIVGNTDALAINASKLEAPQAGVLGFQACSSDEVNASTP